MQVDISEWPEAANAKNVLKLKEYSDEVVFLIENEDQSKLVLKVCDYSLYQRKYEEFEYLKLISQTGINSLSPIALSSKGKDYVILLYTWIPGKSGALEVPKMSKQNQYNIGKRAGMFLSSIHENIVKKPTVIKNFYNDKIDYINNTLKEYNDIFNEELIQNIANLTSEFYNKTFDGNFVFCHGAFDLDSTIINDKKDIAIIHFNDYLIYDPFYDFSKLINTSVSTQNFIVGVVSGYFNDNIPKDFFSIVAIYTIYNLLLEYDKTKDNNLIELLKKLSSDYDNFSLRHPKWYI